MEEKTITITLREYTELLKIEEQKAVLLRFLKGRVKEARDYCDMESLINIFGIDDDVQLPV